MRKKRRKAEKDIFSLPYGPIEPDLFDDTVRKIVVYLGHRYFGCPIVEENVVRLAQYTEDQRQIWIGQITSDDLAFIRVVHNERSMLMRVELYTTSLTARLNHFDISDFAETVDAERRYKRMLKQQEDGYLEYRYA